MISQFNGLIPYSKGLELQEQSFDLVQRKGRPVLLGCEHYPVITLGKRICGHEEFLLSQELLASKWDLKDRGLEIVKTDRGGQATIHSPGQLVIYPIIPIRDYGIPVREFVRSLEITTITWLRLQGIEAHVCEEAGVYTDRGKIAFVGIRVQNGVTRHGVSVNLSNNLELFQWIRSCGLTGRPMDSVEKRGIVIDPAVGFEQWAGVFTSELIRLREKYMF